MVSSTACLSPKLIGVSYGIGRTNAGACRTLLTYADYDGGLVISCSFQMGKKGA